MGHGPPFTQWAPPNGPPFDFWLCTINVIGKRIIAMPFSWPPQMKVPQNKDSVTQLTAALKCFGNHYIRCIIIVFMSFFVLRGAGRSSEVERSLMVRWVVGSILHGVDPLSYFSFQPVLHNWCNKGRGMCYPVYGMVHIKEPLLLIDKSSLCGSSGFPFSLSEWSLTICLTPYNRR